MGKVCELSMLPLGTTDLLFGGAGCKVKSCS